MKSCEFMKETFKGPDLNNISTNFVMNNKESWRKSKYVADLDNYKILKYKNFYSIWNNDDLVGVSSLSKSGVVDQIWINPDYRGKKILSSLLWFFKTRLNKPKLTLGSVHSKDMQEVVKGLSRFKKSWENIVTGDIEPFDIEKIDNYYGKIEKTDWRLILESGKADFNWPMFNKGIDFIKEPYVPWLD